MGIFNPFDPNEWANYRWTGVNDSWMSEIPELPSLPDLSTLKYLLIAVLLLLVIL